MIRFFTSLSLSLLFVAGLGCSNKGVVIPTDESAKKAAAEQPPPPKSFGDSSGTTAPEKGGTPQKVQLKGVGQ